MLCLWSLDFGEGKVPSAEPLCEAGGLRGSTRA